MPHGDLHAIDPHWRCLCWLIRRNGTVDKPHSRKKMVFRRRWILLESDHSDNWFYQHYTCTLYHEPHFQWNLLKISEAISIWNLLLAIMLIPRWLADPQSNSWYWTTQFSREKLTKSNKIPPALPTSCCLRLCVPAGKRPTIRSIAFLDVLDLIWRSRFFFFNKNLPKA